MRVEYVDPGDRKSLRTIRPLAVYFWGTTNRTDFRNFRLDRMGRVEILPEEFQETPGRTLEDFVKAMQRRPPRPESPKL